MTGIYLRVCHGNGNANAALVLSLAGEAEHLGVSMIPSSCSSILYCCYALPLAHAQ